jgi:undecaprenyl-diphosphatase
MTSILQAITLGAIHGLTEFLPSSSSGHLVLVPYLFKWSYQGLSFDVALHAGTALALLIYFRKDWLAIIKNAFTKKTIAAAGQYPKNFLWQIAVASIPAGIIGLAIDKYVEKNFHSLLLIAFNLAFFGWLLWFADKKAKTELSINALTYKKAFLVGLFQSIALIPGVSRSGITLTASRLIGLNREAAARFSFLIGTPAIVGALLVSLPNIINKNISTAFWLGVLTATLTGLAAIRFLLLYLKKNDFSLFLWYRLGIAALIISIFILRF